MVIIFLLMIFVLSQVYLNEALSGRDEALQRLNSQVAELSELLTLERSANTDLRNNIDELSGELRASLSERDEQENELLSLETLRDSLTSRRADAQEQSDRLQSERDLLAAEREELLADPGRPVGPGRGCLQGHRGGQGDDRGRWPIWRALPTICPRWRTCARNSRMTQLAAAQLAMEEAEGQLSDEEKQRLALPPSRRWPKRKARWRNTPLCWRQQPEEPCWTGSETDLALSKRELGSEDRGADPGTRRDRPPEPAGGRPARTVGNPQRHARCLGGARPEQQAQIEALGSA